MQAAFRIILLQHKKPHNTTDRRNTIPMCLFAQAYLPALLESPEGLSAAQAHAALLTSLQAFTSATHAGWYQSIEPGLADRLKKPLLKQVM